MVTLYLGTAFLGVSPDILAPLRTYAEHYSCNVIHLGPLATDEELRMYALRTKKLATWRRQLEELSGSTSLTPQEEALLVQQGYDELVERGVESAYLVDWDQLSEDELTSKDVTRLTRMLIAKINEERVRRELEFLAAAQGQRIATLQAFFPEVKFIFSEGQAVSSAAVMKHLGKAYLGTEMLGRHIDALAMPANGPKVAHPPITKRTIKRLARTGKSAILPHPIPMTDSRNSEGLNNARNYLTTGMLSYPQEPLGMDDLHKGLHTPGAVVCVYADDGAFFANNLIVETRGEAPYIGEDGVVFSAKGISYAAGADTAVAVTDTHAPWEHMGVINASIYAANAMKAETYIVNGDMADMESVNRHAAGFPGKVEGKRLEADLQALRRLMDIIGTIPSLKEKVLIDSNHHEWLSEYVEKNNALKDMLDWDTLALTRFKDWKLLIRGPGDNRVYRFKNKAFRHLDQESLELAMEALGDVEGGHLHRHYRIVQSGILGCGCRLGPKYLGNAITAWQSQMATYTGVGKLAQTSYHTVLHNDEKRTSRFAFRNKIITVRWDANGGDNA